MKEGGGGLGGQVVEVEVAPMVPAPGRPDAPCFTPLASESLVAAPDAEERQQQQRRLVRHEVDLGGPQHGRCFILTDLLTPHECASLVNAAERAAGGSNSQEAATATTTTGGGGGGWEKLGRLFASEYRGGDRLLVMDEQLAHELWQRIKPGLTRDDVLRVRPVGCHPPILALMQFTEES